MANMLFSYTFHYPVLTDWKMWCFTQNSMTKILYHQNPRNNVTLPISSGLHLLHLRKYEISTTIRKKLSCITYQKHCSLWQQSSLHKITTKEAWSLGECSCDWPNQPIARIFLLQASAKLFGIVWSFAHIMLLSMGMHLSNNGAHLYYWFQLQRFTGCKLE